MGRSLVITEDRTIKISEMCQAGRQGQEEIKPEPKLRGRLVQAGLRDVPAPLQGRITAGCLTEAEARPGLAPGPWRRNACVCGPGPGKRSAADR